MLTAYFDDSGTHDSSKVLVWAGFLGPEDRWVALDDQWQTLLRKWKIPYFHMVECVAHEGPFESWKAADSDRAIFEFREIILSLQMFGLGTAVAKLDWDELVTGVHRIYLRTADEYAFSHCLRDAVVFSRDFSPNDQLSVVFDDRQRDNTVVDRIVDFYRKSALDNPKIVSVTHQDMRLFTGLQAADMLAWETYQYALKYLEAGGYPADEATRAHFKRFLEQGMLRGGFLRRHGIERLIKTYQVRPD